MTVMPDDNNLAYTLAGVNRRRSPYDARRSFAERLSAQGADSSPVASPWQGAARLAQALAGAYGTYKADTDEKQAETDRNTKLAAVMAEQDPQKKIGLLAALDPEQGARLSGQLAVDQVKFDRTREGNRDAGNALRSAYGGPGGGTPPQGGYQGMGDSLDRSANATAGIESGGRYDAVGPIANKAGNRAYGKYQVLDTNIGPWTQEILGRQMTPQEFLANPQAQDAVYKGKMGQYVQQYGSPEAASRAWFAGPGGMNNPSAADVNGMTVQRYGQRFAQAYGDGATGGQAPPQGGAPPRAQPVNVQATPPGQPQPLQINMTPNGMPQGDNVGAPPSPSPRGVNGPTMTADGSGTALIPSQPQRAPEIGRPQADPEIVNRVSALVSTGKMSIADADKAISEDINRRWQYAQTQAAEDRRQQLNIQAEDRRQQGSLDRAGAESFIKGTAERYIKDVRPKAENAIGEINNIHQIRQLLDAGAITGTGADARLFTAKLGELVGLPSEQAANTQVLQSALAARVLAGMGGSLGAGFSNADRDFVERAKGGQITMTEPALRRLIDIGERQSRSTIDAHGKEVARLNTIPSLGTMGKEFFTLPPVQDYATWRDANPLAPVMPPPAGAPQRPAAPSSGNITIDLIEAEIARRRGGR